MSVAVDKVSARSAGREPRPRSARFGEILLRRGITGPRHIQEALAYQVRHGGLIGEILEHWGLITPEQTAEVLAEQFAMQRIEVHNTRPSPDALLHLPASLCRECRVIPLRVRDGSLLVGIVDPADLLAQDRVRGFVRDHVVEWAMLTPREYETLEKVYDGLHSVVEGEGARGLRTAPPERFGVNGEDAQERPAVRILDELLERALRDRATDIHLEPEHDHCLVRMRIDGHLRDVLVLPLELHTMLVARAKVLAATDVANHLTPQDGHFSVAVGDEHLAIRLSVLPVIGGESIVLRLLADGEQVPSLSDLGICAHCLAKLNSVLDRPQGLIMVTGPTGSGKSTTLCAALGRVLARNPNVVTIEDPVERNIPRAKQAQVNERAGLTFAAALRAILRHDPDVIMVGEVRDLETARICAQSAMTGHLVLSTVHTNDALATPTRLQNIGLEPYLIASALSAVYAQRLVRLTCRHCGRVTPIPDTLQRHLRRALRRDDIPAEEFRGQGCDVCDWTGFVGREAIAEIFIMDDTAQRLLCEEGAEAKLRAYARKQGMETLADAAYLKLHSGVTTALEVLSVLPGNGA